MSTGGAAEKLGRELHATPSFSDELDYVSLFLEQLEIDPNEERSVSRNRLDGMG